MKAYHLILIALVVSLSGCVTSGPGPKANTIRRAGITGGEAIANANAQYRFVQIQAAEDIPSPEAQTAPISYPAVDARFTYSDEVAFGDLLEIRIVDASPQSPFYRSSADFITGPFEVPEDGLIAIPYVGEIEVTNRHLAELTRKVRAKIQAVSPTAEASVIRVSRMPKRAYVVGNVEAPGAVSIDREGFGILDAIASTGGPMEAGHLYSFTLNRKGTQYPLTAAQLVSHRPLVMDGDVIQVERDHSLSYHVMGLVREPGRYDFTDASPTLMEALAQAGGLAVENAKLGNPQGVFVFRKLPNGEKAAYSVDLSKPINTFLAQDFELQANDVVYVSESPIAPFQRFSRTTLPIAAIAAAAVTRG